MNLRGKIVEYTYKNNIIENFSDIISNNMKVMKKILNEINFYLIEKTTSYINVINLSFSFTISIIGNYGNPYDSPDTFYGDECREVEILPRLPPIFEPIPQESSFSCDYVPMTTRPELPAITAPTTILNDIAHPVINNQNTDCVLSQMTSPLEQEIVTAFKSAPSEPHPLIISKLGTPQSQVELPTASKSVPVSVIELLTIISKSSPVSFIEQHHVHSDNIIFISENTIIKELREKYDELNLILYLEDILRKEPISNNNNVQFTTSHNVYKELTADSPDLLKQMEEQLKLMEEQLKQQALLEVQCTPSIESKAMKIINNIMVSAGNSYRMHLQNNPDVPPDMKTLITNTMKEHILTPLWKISPGEEITSNKIAGMITNICQYQVSNNPYNLGDTELNIMTHINVNVNITNRAISLNIDPDVKLNDPVAYDSLFKAYSKKTK